MKSSEFEKETLPRGDILVIAAWAATIFGLAEGIVLDISRGFPAFIAPYPVSADILWVAPVEDLLVFGLAAIGLLILMRLARRWIKGLELQITYGFFVFLGILTLLIAAKVIHPVSAAVLALGVSIAAFRKLRGSENSLTDYLRRRLIWIPAVIIALGLGVATYDRAREVWLYNQLPPPQSGSDQMPYVIPKHNVGNGAFFYQTHGVNHEMLIESDVLPGIL